MSGETPITVTGGLIRDPELEYTQRGTPKCKLVVIHSPRVYDKTSQQWGDGDPSFHNVLVWRAKGEAVANTFRKGSQVVIVGTLKQEHWTDQQGEKRSMWIVTADEVGQMVLPQKGQGQSQQSNPPAQASSPADYATGQSQQAQQGELTPEEPPF